MKRDPYDIYDPSDITYLDEEGTRPEIDRFMRVWAAVDNPPWEWTVLAQRVYSKKVTPKRTKTKAERNDRMCYAIQQRVDEGSSERQAIIDVCYAESAKLPEPLDPDSIRREVWAKRDKDRYAVVSLFAELDRK